GSCPGSCVTGRVTWRRAWPMGRWRSTAHRASRAKRLTSRVQWSRSAARRTRMGTMKAILAGLLWVAALAVPAAANAQAPAIEQDYDPDPAIWLIEDEDTRIYLFGTVHVLPEGFRWRSPRLDAIVEEADALVRSEERRGGKEWRSRWRRARS